MLDYLIIMQKNISDSLIEQVMDIHRVLRHCMPFTKQDANDLNFQQLHAVMLISEEEGITMKAFAQHLRITSPSATSFINRLVRMGWVQRFADKENRKLVRLRISPRGRKVLEKRVEAKKLKLREFTSLLSTEDQRDLLRILQNTARALEHRSS